MWWIKSGGGHDTQKAGESHVSIYPSLEKREVKLVDDSMWSVINRPGVAGAILEKPLSLNY